MNETASPFLAPWSNFYVMTGSSAAALTGLMFIVITIVTGEERLRRSPDGISTFSTPTVLHFGAALFFSAVLLAPWPSLTLVAGLLGVASLCALVYVLRVGFLQTRLQAYTPDAEDWFWYTVLPAVAYGVLAISAISLLAAPQRAFFGVAAAVVLLLFIGIHNAWDVVTFLATGQADALPDRPAKDD